MSARPVHRSAVVMVDWWLPGGLAGLDDDELAHQAVVL
jgi:hypothetical protein